MPYNDKYEYTQEIRDEIEYAIKDYYGDHSEVIWYKENDPLNFKKKVDVTVVTVLRLKDRVYNMQIKRSSYPKSFSITSAAMESYLTDNLPLDGLIVCLANSDSLYLFSWDSFIDLAQELYTTWKYEDYYIIPIKDVTRNIKHKRMMLSN